MPFEIFKQDKDEVIMLVNYLVEKGETHEETHDMRTEKHENKNVRIKVNDKTATGGWY